MCVVAIVAVARLDTRVWAVATRLLKQRLDHSCRWHASVTSPMSYRYVNIPGMMFVRLNALYCAAFKLQATLVNLLLF